MRQRFKNRGILQDDAAQALTEFVVIIPIIMLIFAAALQTSVIAQTSQLCNYAAFNSARTYATSFSQFKKSEGGSDADAHDKAEDRAKSAAAFVLAPVSHAQPGEGLIFWNLVRDIAAELPPEVENLYSFAEGWAVAWIYRLKDFKIASTRGGDAGLTQSSLQHPSDADRKKTLHCSFTYHCPLTIPGLREMWNYLYSGDGPVSWYDSMGTFDQHWDAGYPLEISALADISGYVNELQNFLLDLANTLDSLSGDGILGDLLGGLGLSGGFLHDLNVVLDQFITTIYDYAQVAGATSVAKIPVNCEMGFEPWSGTPRLKGRDDSDAQVDPSMQACQEAITNNQARINATGEWARAECEDFVEASNNWYAADQELQNCQNNDSHPNHDTGCQQETQDEFDLRMIRDSEKPRCDDATDVVQQMGQENSEAVRDACANSDNPMPGGAASELDGL